MTTEIFLGHSVEDSLGLYIEDSSYSVTNSEATGGNLKTHSGLKLSVSISIWSVVIVSTTAPSMSAIATVVTRGINGTTIYADPTSYKFCHKTLNIHCYEPLLSAYTVSTSCLNQCGRKIGDGKYRYHHEGKKD